jgi:hypothetical protein
MKSVGFKEWSLVCDALGRGEQSIILRKGGIAEGRSGFSFRYHEFFLFPTFFHAQTGKVRDRRQENRIGEQSAKALIRTFSRGEKGLLAARQNRSTRNGEIVILLYAKVERAVRIDSLVTAEAFAPLHVLVPEVVRERFGYNGEGLNVAFVRVFRLEREWAFPNEKRFGGCRSWVDLPEAPELEMQAVINDVAFANCRAKFDAIVSSSRTE